MKIKCKLNDGTFSSIPNVNWHATHDGGKLIVRSADVFRHFVDVNAYRESTGVSPRNVFSAQDCLDMIEFAEAPFTVLSEKGSVMADIRYGGFDDYWNVH